MLLGSKVNALSVPKQCSERPRVMLLKSKSIAFAKLDAKCSFAGLDT
jgi:hypothetical protein